MILLGIHDGHNCGASIFIDGKLVCALSEEKITRKKNEYGYPRKAIEACLKVARVKRSQVDFVAVSTKNLPPKYFRVKRNTTFSLSDYYKEQEMYWYPKIYKNKKIKYLKIFKNKIISKKKLGYDFKFVKTEDDFDGMQKARKNLIMKEFKLKPDQIEFFDHHKCHAYYGYYGSGISKDNVLVVTSDGGGDNTNGSIWASKDKQLKELYRTNICNIGRMYRYITLMLGMKPTEHEFKVMGMAGYGYQKSNFYENVVDIFRETLTVQGIKFKYLKKPKDNFFYFKEKLKGLRFDVISYAIQKYTEELLLKWFLNISKKYRSKNFIFSGGVAQNIKATQKIIEHSKIKSIFIPPGPGDESLCIGAAYCKLAKTDINKKNISNILNPYVGLRFGKKDLNFIKKDRSLSMKRTTPKQIAKLISEGHVVARFAFEPSEFGPRALGNRSILADPRRQDIINHINKKIKVRDFWMPFAPSILEQDIKKYIDIKKNHIPHFMTISFDATKKGTKCIPAAVHPFDKTSRPQIVLKSQNKNYHDLISQFKKITGVGAVLNTSFNLHGEPIVSSPRDAVRTLKKSGINFLFIGDYLVKKL